MILRRLSQNVPRVSCGADLFQSRHRGHGGYTEKKLEKDFSGKARLDVLIEPAKGILKLLLR
jgi:hypothetical protein